MDNNIQEYKNEINDLENKMLVNYKELVVDYENCIQLQERIINQYGTEIIRKCSQVVAYLTGESIINWRIVLLDGRVVYSSPNKQQFEEWHLDISTLNLAPGTQFRLQAYMSVNAYNSEDILEYTPSSDTLYYYFNQIEEHRNVVYVSTIYSPESPPILKCSSLKAFNNALVVTKYELRLASTGKTIYESGKHKVNNTWTIDLYDFDIEPGTQLILHAGVVAGDDSEPYVIIEYSPYDYKGNFELEGNAFKTLFMYVGYSIT